MLPSRVAVSVAVATGAMEVMAALGATDRADGLRVAAELAVDRPGLRGILVQLERTDNRDPRGA